MANAFKKGAFKLTAFAQAPSVGGFDAIGFWDGGFFTNKGTSRILTADTGSFAITGLDATFRVNMPAVTAQLTVTGNSAGLRVARKLYPTVGSVTLTGNPANVFRTFYFIMGTGQFTVTGNPAALVAARQLPSQPGAYTVTGLDATFCVTMPAATGTIIVTGNDAQFKRGVSLFAATGNYNLTGYPAKLVHNYNFSVESGVFNVSYFDADLFTSTYFYNDTEIMFVPFEVQSIVPSFEDRTMVVQAEENIQRLAEYRTVETLNRVRKSA